MFSYVVDASLQRWLCASEFSCGAIETERIIANSDINLLHIIEFLPRKSLTDWIVVSSYSKYIDLAKPKSGALVSLFSSPSLY